ncbi:MAG: AlpA family transcriptional regulator [Pseudomonadota bacterium]|uniref:helix-turn-helix transcriptional regulator n=1 Tax=Gallaecimonas pentaromativorans TaxID=584787 RepID=UPI00067EB011|nr:AlpA family transcriptional regulator [Gallaecimonas pentaromativorans]MED5525616.1 AlpA family transcriptional regulator [Pseudomonadota bacterium]
MRFIKLKEVQNLTSLPRSTIYKYIAEGRFPKQISLGERNVAWLESEIQTWIREKVEQRQNQLMQHEMISTPL